MRPPVLYRALLRLLPRGLRSRQGQEMERLFLAYRTEATERWGVVGAIGAWVMAFIDVLRLRLSYVLRRRRDPLSPRRSNMLETALLDLRHAARSLWRTPGFTAIAILTLGVGLGANATIFSVVNGVLLAPLPYDEPDRLVNIWNDLGNGAQSLPAVHMLDFRDYRERADQFEAFAAGSGGPVVGLQGILTGDGSTERVELSPITANFLPLLGVDPVLGRHFTEEEEAVGGAKVAIISYGLWQRRFGGNRGVVGNAMLIDGLPHQIVGVLPRGFRLLLPAEAFLIRHSDVWVPLQVDYANAPPRNFTGFTVFGRLRPGVTVTQAQEQMDAIAAELRAEHAVHAASNLRIRVVPLHRDVVKDVELSLTALLGAVGFMLLIVCANLANLLLARGAARGREYALQRALGASRYRMVWRVLTESLLIAGAGAVVALGVVQLGIEFLSTLQPVSLPRLSEVELDRTVFLFTLGIASITAILFGAAPAIRGARAAPATTLQRGSRIGRATWRDRGRNLLVVTEIALSVVLLTGAGLMVRSFRALQRVDPGFDPRGALTVEVRLPNAKYPDDPDRLAFFETISEQLRGLPGVTHVASISQLPLTGSGSLQPYAYDEETARNWEQVTADERAISPGFFEAIGATLQSGRGFSDVDVRQDRDVIIVDDVLAERVWPDERDPVGMLLQVERTGSDNMFAEVVGVVQHVRLHDIRRDVREQIYQPIGDFGRRSFVIRTAGDASSLVDPVRLAIADLDPDVPVSAIRPMTAYVDDALVETRFTSSLMSSFGVFAVLLAALGVYGVISYTVSLRAREFGIRLALGEHPRMLERRIVGDGMRVIGASGILGVVLAIALAVRFHSLWFSVSPLDPVTLVGVVGIIAAAGLIACYVPARRATSANPLSVLNQD